ncbi:DUF4041 domain-containing protein [Streptomyces sp. NPDC059697]|uniref:DUF4041 domain-containing protein n=1 Tax=Streptomyces sp. NPDC059697 TaxID=3346912 RepID=UPI00368B6E23
MSDNESESDNDVDESATASKAEAPTGRAQGAPGTRPDQTFAGPPTALPFQGVDPAPLLARIADLEAALATTQSGADVIDLSDQRALQDVGIYRYHHPLESAAAYKDRLRSLEGQINDVIKSGRAILAADMFTFDGSLARGRKLVGDLSKLMLRAYNAEADNCVRSLRSGNARTAQKRLESAVTAIEKLGTIMEMRINPEYHTLRIAELELTADFQMKVQEERERARQERRLLREQRRAEQELAAEKERLEKERAHYISVLESLRAKGDDTAVTELSRRLADIEKAIAANDYRIANIRAGYVYVISNIGAFGPNIVKIGMTRRLEPMDRVRELGDASVPFRYDVHAMFFSEDAVTLESELHKAFADRRVNFVNERREFFFATPSEVRALLADRVGGLLEFTEEPAALEYFQSRSRWPQQS